MPTRKNATLNLVLTNMYDYFNIPDDTTASEIVHEGDVSNAQSITDQVILWPQENRMHLNPDKYIGIRISLARNPEEFHAVVVEGKELEVVSTAKLLGLTTGVTT